MTPYEPLRYSKRSLGSLAPDPRTIPKLPQSAFNFEKRPKESVSQPPEREPIIAWRTWRWYVPDCTLVSVAYRHTWPPRMVMEAVCLPAHSHPHAVPAPAEGCSCGIYAVKDTIALQASVVVPNKRVFGLVALWGRVIEGEYGYRAQFAYPQELWVIDDTLLDMLPANKYMNVKHEIVAGLQENYAVPVHLEKTTPSEFLRQRHHAPR